MRVLIMGGDGYIGWSLAVALALDSLNEVLIADNFAKRSWQDELQVAPLLATALPYQRIRTLTATTGLDNMRFQHSDLRDFRVTKDLVSSFMPDAVIHAAHQPSAPFSMSSADHAGLTLTTNSLTNLNTLWAIAACNPDILYIKFGSAGCYLSVDSDFIPNGKVDFTFLAGGKQRQIRNSWLPMHATDFYHLSKASDFLVTDLCVDLWSLHAITIQQSTVFGATTDFTKSADLADLYPPLCYDFAFGTVVNRFACQLATGEELSVYGDGTDVTGIISIATTVDRILSLLSQPPDAGVHQVVHNYSYRVTIDDLAKRLIAIFPGTISYVQSPRGRVRSLSIREVETLPQFASMPGTNLDAELAELVDHAFRHRHLIDQRLLTCHDAWTNLK